MKKAASNHVARPEKHVTILAKNCVAMKENANQSHANTRFKWSVTVETGQHSLTVAALTLRS